VISAPDGSWVDGTGEALIIGSIPSGLWCLRSSRRLVSRWIAMSNDLIRRHHLTETVHNLEQVYKRHQQVIRKKGYHMCAVLMQEGVSAEDAQFY
jgi:hypothetical protein